MFSIASPVQNWGAFISLITCPSKLPPPASPPPPIFPHPPSPSPMCFHWNCGEFHLVWRLSCSLSLLLSLPIPHPPSPIPHHLTPPAIILTSSGHSVLLPCTLQTDKDLKGFCRYWNLKKYWTEKKYSEGQKKVCFYLGELCTQIYQEMWERWDCSQPYLSQARRAESPQ